MIIDRPNVVFRGERLVIPMGLPWGRLVSTRKTAQLWGQRWAWVRTDGDPSEGRDELAQCIAPCWRAVFRAAFDRAAKKPRRAWRRAWLGG